MPYATKICASCNSRGDYYHNVRNCRKCGKPNLVAKRRFEDASRSSERAENKVLRAEVNALRLQLGIGIKYVEYGRKPTK
jgi:predicted amidophosphoribosyltransferase